MTQRNTTKILYASAARDDSQTHNSDDLDNLEGKGVEILIDITAISGVGADLTVQVQSKDLAGNYVDIAGAVTAALTATGQTRLVVYPGIAESANVQVSSVVGRTWRTTATITGTTPSVTFSASASIIA